MEANGNIRFEQGMHLPGNLQDGHRQVIGCILPVRARAGERDDLADAGPVALAFDLAQAIQAEPQDD